MKLESCSFLLGDSTQVASEQILVRPSVLNAVRYATRVSTRDLFYSRNIQFVALQLPNHIKPADRMPIVGLILDTVGWEAFGIEACT